jgi:hypothetical protein
MPYASARQPSGALSRVRLEMLRKLILLPFLLIGCQVEPDDELATYTDAEYASTLQASTSAHFR